MKLHEEKEIYDEEPTLEKMIEEISELAHIEGSEYGEWLIGLCNLHHFMSYCPSDHFKEAWENEVKEEYIRLKTEFVVIEEEITRTFIDRRLECVG